MKPRPFARFKTDQGRQPGEEEQYAKTNKTAGTADRQPVPYQQRSPEPVFCTENEQCRGCPYPAHGIVCWHRGGGCLRTDMEGIERRRK